jgi:soluble lytic murein transglycosylase
MARVWLIRIAIALLLLSMLGGSLTAMWWHNRLHRYDDLIALIAADAGLDPRLIHAVVWKESRFRTLAVGAAGESGLMQITPPVGEAWAAATRHPDYRPELLFDPEINLRVGAWYLARALQQWSDRRDPLPYALAQYNAGRSNVLRWAEYDGNHPDTFIANITYPGTQHYVRTILKRYRG